MQATFSHILKHWRHVRRFSQLALSAETGLSSRHISFLETGRSRPSRKSVLTLARVLNMPKPAVNSALHAAGFAPEFPKLDMDDASLQPVMSALMTILNNHAPMPAIVIDAAWNIVGANTPALAMIDFLPFHGSNCVVEALINDDPQNPCFLNWSVLAGWTLLRLQNEISHAGADPKSISALQHIYQRLLADPRVQTDVHQSFSEFGPVLTMELQAGELQLSLFTMMAEFSTVQDVSMSERRVELFFPANSQTRAYFEDLAVS